MVAVLAAVLQPARGVGREVRVLAEDLFTAHVLLELDQVAPAAHEHVQRIERLHLVELLLREIALAERRHAEVDERVLERRAAEPAARAVDGDVISETRETGVQGHEGHRRPESLLSGRCQLNLRKTGLTDGPTR